MLHGSIFLNRQKEVTTQMPANFSADKQNEVYTSCFKSGTSIQWNTI